MLATFLICVFILCRTAHWVTLSFRLNEVLNLVLDQSSV